ncbi:serine protease 33-like [Salminus brasiliensis]|uniref:serine protease 33-like n=1 Tax=Salminus brasiliensis TaxID=930266 RepID=UPI003B8352F4
MRVFLSIFINSRYILKRLYNHYRYHNHCTHYHHHCNLNSSQPSNLNVALLSLPECGVATQNTRIYGGQDATPDFWPWQVSIHRNGRNFCGGSLINSDWVLTSGECVYPFSPTSRWTVFLGRQTQDSNNPNEVSRSVLKVFKHPDLDVIKTMDNNIGLLQLNSSVTFTQYISPVCLAAAGSTFFNSTSAWFTSWGVVSTGASPNTLQEIEVPVIGNRKCNCLYGVGMIRDNMMCAGFLTGGKGLCIGDIGSPLVIKQNGRWIQAGIGSFNRGCGVENYPDVYTRVSQYQTWITETISNNTPGFIMFNSNGIDGDLSVSCDGLPALTTLAPATTTTSAPSSSSTAAVSFNNSTFLQSVVMYFPPEIYTPSPAATTASSSASESSSFLSILEPAPDPADIQKVPDSVGRHPANWRRWERTAHTPTFRGIHLYDKRKFRVRQLENRVSYASWAFWWQGEALP